MSGSRRSNVPPSRPRTRNRWGGGAMERGEAPPESEGGASANNDSARTPSEKAHGLEIVGRPRLEIEPLVEARREVDDLRLLAVVEQDLLRPRVERRDVVHQLDPVRVTGEPLDRRDLESHRDRDRPAAVHERRL